MSFAQALRKAEESIRDRSTFVHPKRWQSVDVADKPEMGTHEVLNHTIRAQVVTEDLDVLRSDISPNLPWADDHFEERVAGQPFNPGDTWRTWPWGNSADKFRTAGDGKFSHTYMERFWPKQAGENRQPVEGKGYANVGVRYEYGDLADVVGHLLADPLSRQAYLPIFFPEDTGKLDVRVPCTLGYHFIMRHGYLHIVYYIRSCDAMRHMRDDVYLTVRLLLWVLDHLRELDADWRAVKPGLFTMHVTSLHVFRNDYLRMFSGKTPP